MSVTVILHEMSLGSGCRLLSCTLLAAWFWQRPLRDWKGELKKHIGVSGTWAGEMRSKGIPCLWGPTELTGGRQGRVCCERHSAEQRLSMH